MVSPKTVVWMHLASQALLLESAIYSARKKNQPLPSQNCPISRLLSIRKKYNHSLKKKKPRRRIARSLIASMMKSRRLRCVKPSTWTIARRKKNKRVSRTRIRARFVKKTYMTKQWLWSKTMTSTWKIRLKKRLNGRVK